MSRTDTRHLRTRPRAFTLVEAAVSIALCTILVVVVGGSLTNSIAAVDKGADANARVRSASDALDQFNADLAIAESFNQRSAQAVEFTVPDRYQQGYNPIVRYQWSGTPGDPLLRSFDGSTLAPVIGNVQSLNFNYLVRPAPIVVENAESTLRTVDQPAGSILATFTVDKDDFAAQYVFPTLPSGTSSWSVTKVQLRLARKGGSNNYSVQIRTADSTKTPTTTVLAEAIGSIAGLSSTIGWVEVPIGPVTGLDPRQGVCIVVTSKSGSGGDQVTVESVQGSSSAMLPNTHWLTWNSSSGWSGWNDQRDMRFVLLGKATVVQEQPPQ